MPKDLRPSEGLFLRPGEDGRCGLLQPGKFSLISPAERGQRGLLYPGGQAQCLQLEESPVLQVRGEGTEGWRGEADPDTLRSRGPEGRLKGQEDEGLFEIPWVLDSKQQLLLCLNLL